MRTSRRSWSPACSTDCVWFVLETGDTRSQCELQTATACHHRSGNSHKLEKRLTILSIQVCCGHTQTMHSSA